MKNEEIRKIWDDFVKEYEEFFKSNHEIWYEKLNNVKDYIMKNNKLPSLHDKNKEIGSLGSWLIQQKIKYNKNTQIMKNEEIRDKWEEFINEYEEFLKSNEEIWYENLNKVINYIKKNNKLPVGCGSNKNIKELGAWLSQQKIKYNKNTQIMKNEEIRDKWEEFINEYEEFFKTTEEIWYENLNKVIEYIKENNKLPSGNDKNKDIKSLGTWIFTQKQNYKNNTQIMKNLELKIKWEEFTNEYEEFFKTTEEIWYENLNKVIKYIKENNKLPSENDKNKDIKSLGYWITGQKKNYKNNTQIMKNEEIRKIWDDFVKEYKELFKSNHEIWYETLNKVIEYIKENDNLPSKHNKNKDIKSLGTWVCVQKQNYKNNIKIMKDKEIRDKWEQFIDTHKELF